VHGTPVPAVDWVVGVAIALAVVLAWGAYFRWKDHHPEPVGHVAFALLLGAVAAGIALLVYRGVGLAGGPVDRGDGVGSAWRFCLLVVGPIEEGAKALVVLALIVPLREFDEESDALVYATVVALGFSCVESVLYLPLESWQARIARALATPLSHAVFASVWGFGLGYAAFHARSRLVGAVVVVATLALSAAAHGAYDALLLAHDATLPAGGVVLVLWIALVLRARRVVARLARGDR
jgi:RsiW-degrading membrane proteinase PrsW (M82 family)